MDEAKQKAIRTFWPELHRVLVAHHLMAHLHQDAGGFLTDREIQDVAADDVNYKQMDTILDILVKKDNEAFLSFCSVLDSPAILHGVWAVRLMNAAGMSEFNKLSYTLITNILCNVALCV